MGRMKNIWVQAEARHRMQVDDILKMNVNNTQGGMVPLSSFVSAKWAQGPVQVVRYNSYESMRIGGDAAPGYTPGEAMAEQKRRGRSTERSVGEESVSTVRHRWAT